MSPKLRAIIIPETCHLINNRPNFRRCPRSNRIQIISPPFMSITSDHHNCWSVHQNLNPDRRRSSLDNKVSTNLVNTCLEHLIHRPRRMCRIKRTRIALRRSLWKTFDDRSARNFWPTKRPKSRSTSRCGLLMSREMATECFPDPISQIVAVRHAACTIERRSIGIIFKVTDREVIVTCRMNRRTDQAAR